MNKQELRNMFSEFKQETLEKNKNIIDKYKEDYYKNLETDCDLVNDKITVEISFLRKIFFIQSFGSPSACLRIVCIP